MRKIAIQSSTPGFQVKEKLASLGLLKGTGEIDDGIVRLPAGVWLFEDHGSGAMTISVGDDELDAALAVIHKVIPNSTTDPRP